MAQPLKINTYILFVNKATQIGVSKNIQLQKIGPYKIIDSPTLVTDKLEDFSRKQITRHRILQQITILPQRILRSRTNYE